MPHTDPAAAPTTLPKNQQWLIDVFTILGYKPKDGNKKLGDAPYAGLCCGIAHMGVPAVLGGDIESFKQRFYRIYALQKKFKKEDVFSIEEEFDLLLLFPKHQYGSEEERACIKILSTFYEYVNNESLRDIQAFCDNVVLYQFAPLFEKLFGKSRSWDEMIPFLFSPKIKALGGIEKPIENFQQSFTQSELIHYFQTLRTSLENTSPITQPLSLVLSSLQSDGNGIHSINVSFHQGKWRLIDANDLELMSTEFASDEQIATRVMCALGANVQASWDGNSKLNMLTETYVSGSFRDACAPRLASWKSDIMAITSSSSASIASDNSDMLDVLFLKLPDQGMDLDSGFQPPILELRLATENSAVETTENSSTLGFTSVTDYVTGDYINFSFNSHEALSQPYDFSQENREEEERFIEPLRSDLFSSVDETLAEAVATSNVPKAVKKAPVNSHRRKRAEDVETEEEKEVEEFSPRKRTLVNEYSGSYRFFGSPAQEQPHIVSTINTNQHTGY